jgi:hypothetical protein
MNDVVVATATIPFIVGMGVNTCGAGARVQVDQPVDRLGYNYFIQPIQRIMTDGYSLWPKRGAGFFAASSSRLARQ